MTESEARQYDRQKDLLREALEHLEVHQDKGPPGHGWKSPELQQLIREIQVAVDE